MDLSIPRRMRALAFLGVCWITPVVWGSGSGSSPTRISEINHRLSLYDGMGGASCSHFLANAIPWEQRGGDWLDAQGKRFGGEPFAVASPGPVGTTWDVTALVRKWLKNDVHKAQFFLRTISGSGFASFFSRESKNVADWPMLVLQFSNGSRKLLKPEADTYLDCSTYTSRGTQDTVTVSRQHNPLLQFDLPEPASGTTLTLAKLVLSSAAVPGGGRSEVGVFEIAAPSLPVVPVQLGLAERYPSDRGIERDPNVLFSAKFDQASNWKAAWAKDSSGEFDIVKEDVALRFSPLSDAALRIYLKKGSNLASDLRLKLKDIGGERDELYFRYYLRLADDWNPTIADGKMPGMAGTYSNAGWGGRRVDGTDGWSMRGCFLRGFETGNPLRGLTQLCSYAYHADMAGTYGDIWPWTGALLEKNRWYAIEQYIRLNHQDASDGVLKVWLDGQLVMDRNNIRFRKVNNLRIEWVWFNVYHGGAEVSPQDQHLYIDNVVVASKYIGPMMKMDAK